MWQRARVDLKSFIPANAVEPKLRRSLTLPLLTLCGIGVTVGAGIYVLIGAVAGHARIHTPLAFVLAGTVMGLTVASYSELCARFRWRLVRRPMSKPRSIDAGSPLSLV